MRLQIVHNRVADQTAACFTKRHMSRSTLVVQVPSYDEVMAFIQTHLVKTSTWEKPHVLTLKTGIAICHDDDQYNKKVGREMATSRLKDVEYRLNGLDFHNDHIWVSLGNYTNLERRGFTTHIGIRIYKDSKKLRVMIAGTHGH